MRRAAATGNNVGKIKTYALYFKGYHPIEHVHPLECAAGPPLEGERRRGACGPGFRSTSLIPGRAPRRCGACPGMSAHRAMVDDRVELQLRVRLHADGPAP